nr:MAG TPA: hypothetical protein [Caudoviricetes sp.]
MTTITHKVILNLRNSCPTGRTHRFHFGACGKEGNPFVKY